VIDLDFEGLMPESDVKHLIQQLCFSYSANSKASNPVHLHLLGLKVSRSWGRYETESFGTCTTDI
jgi:hypothetical protein